MTKIKLLSDYKDPRFKRLFTNYFLELNITLDPDTKIFDFMQKSKKTEKLKTYVYLVDLEFVGFIMFQEEIFTSKSNFFIEKTLFIREYYVDNSYRNKGIGHILLNKCHEYAKKHHIYKTILTTHTKIDYYLKRGYIKDMSYQAKNEDAVLVKHLK
jgi:GNAT superfamily N-acetyltransferase